MIRHSNLPPGCYESDPRAPWNQEEPDEATTEEILDEIFAMLTEFDLNPDYKGKHSIRYIGGEIEVKPHA